MNIHYVKYGQGRPLVFFHGWGFDHQIWLSLVSRLSTSFQLILVDLPGFGLTQVMDWDVFKTQLLAQLPQQSVVIGWSMGGLYATRLAIEEPSRVEALINVTSSPFFIMHNSWPGITKKLFRLFYTNLSKNISTTLRDFVQLQLNNSLLHVEPGHLPSLEGLKYGLGLLESWDLREGIKNLSQPTCYMFGRLDPITPTKTMYAMQAMYPNFKYVLFKKAAHMPFLSHQDLFVTELMEFLQ